MKTFRNLMAKIGKACMGFVAAGAALMYHSAAQAQATIPASVQTAIDDSVEMIDLIGYAMLAVVLAVLFFRWIRRVMR